jgi:hypothetical protein
VAAPPATPDGERPLIHLSSRCASVDEFVQRFAPFASDGALAIPASGELAIGREGRFLIRLVNGTVVMRGRCRVSEVTPPDKPGGRAFMRVQLVEMDDASRDVHRRVLAARRPAPPFSPFASTASRLPAAAAALPRPARPGATMLGVPLPARTAPAPAPAPAVAAQPAAADHAASPPIAAAVAAAAAAAAPAEARVPGASFTLPANPLSELEAADLASFIECTLFETEGDPPPSDDEPGRAEASAEAAPPAQADAGPGAPPPAAAAMAASPSGAQLRRTLMHAAPFALCTVVGVLAGVVLHPSRPPAPPAAAVTAKRAPEPAEAPAVAVPAAPAPASARAPAAPPPGAAAAPAPGDRPSALTRQAGASRDCFATVDTEPDGVRVAWGGRRLGVTPLHDVPVPCGAAP